MFRMVPGGRSIEKIPIYINIIMWALVNGRHLEFQNDGNSKM